MKRKTDAHTTHDRLARDCNLMASLALLVSEGVARRFADSGAISLSTETTELLATLDLVHRHLGRYREALNAQGPVAPLTRAQADFAENGPCGNADVREWTETRLAEGGAQS